MSERKVSARPGIVESSHVDPPDIRGSQEPRRNGSAAQSAAGPLGRATRRTPLTRPRIHSLKDLALVDAAPLGTRDLAALIGMSATFIRAEIRSGHLRAVAVGHGRKRVFRITVGEARRYARDLGLI